MSDLEYTQHAVGHIAKRQIQVAWIERAVQQPDVVEDDEFDAELEHRLGKVPEPANRVLRVIVTKTDLMRLVTLHLDRRMKGKI
jgi:hypothetical protein